MKTEAFGSGGRREEIAAELATTIISKASKELQQWVTSKSFKPDLVKILIRHIELPQSEGVFDDDRRDALREAAEDEGSVRYSDKQLGVELHNWHSGQGDPIYQVGSLIFARKSVPNDLVDDAIGSLESLARKSKSRKEKAELKRLVSALKRAE